jgi:hypothetical protein
MDETDGFDERRIHDDSDRRQPLCRRGAQLVEAARNRKAESNAWAQARSVRSRPGLRAGRAARKKV